MSRILVIVIAVMLMISACSSKHAKQAPNEDPFVAAEREAPILADTDTLTYDFLAESTPAHESSGTSLGSLGEADLPELQDSAPATEAIGDPKPAQAAAEGISAIMPPAASAGPLFWVQVFASSSRKSAEEYAVDADGKLNERVRILFLEPYYKVLVGGFDSRERAVELRQQLTNRGFEGAWIFEK